MLYLYIKVEAPTLEVGIIMNSMDIPFPEMQYGMLADSASFNLIQLLESPSSQASKVDMVIRILKFSNEDFEALAAGETPLSELVPSDGKLFDVSYIRDCRLSSVTKREWSKSFGPPSMADFIDYVKNSNPDSFVRVVSVKSPDYSLKNFNSRYKIAR
jgi:hypothetical protein